MTTPTPRATGGLHLLRRLGLLCFIIITFLSLLLGYKFARTSIAADYYRDRLREELAKAEAMRQTFNEVVKKTVITELLVNEDDSVCVVFVAADNTERVVNTPFKKGAEMNVDFIRREDGRLFLRRIYDENTKPKEALFIDPDLQTVDWKPATRGNTTYTQLNQTGRWIVTVSGGGALELTKADDKIKREPLKPLPTIKEYAVIEKEISAKVEEIGFTDVMQALFGGK